MSADDLAPLCDVVGCTSPIFAWVDERAHCWPHFEDAWEYMLAIDIDAAAREYLAPLTYRQDPGQSFYAKQVRALAKAQSAARKNT